MQGEQRRWPPASVARRARPRPMSRRADRVGRSDTQGGTATANDRRPDGDERSAIGWCAVASMGSLVERVSDAAEGFAASAGVGGDGDASALVGDVQNVQLTGSGARVDV